jgi:hypothetical protein
MFDRRTILKLFGLAPAAALAAPAALAQAAGHARMSALVGQTFVGELKWSEPIIGTIEQTEPMSELYPGFAAGFVDPLSPLDEPFTGWISKADAPEPDDECDDPPTLDPDDEMQGG